MGANVVRTAKNSKVKKGNCSSPKGKIQPSLRIFADQHQNAQHRRPMKEGNVSPEYNFWNM